MTRDYEDFYKFSKKNLNKVRNYIKNHKDISLNELQIELKKMGLNYAWFELMDVIRMIGGKIKI